jgi:hypothetical protein
MRTVFALATGIVLGTVAALWIAARGGRQAGPAEASPAPASTAVAASEPTMSEEAPE